MAMNMSIARWVAGTAVAAVALWSVSALAAAPPPAVPSTLTQQGRILDKAGAPVSSKVAITFTLYNSATKSAAANNLWTETQNITLDDGYFSAQLGAVTAIDPTLFDGSVLYLGVTVGSDDEMTPRQPLTSVPYAFAAGSAATVPFAGLTGIPALCTAGQYLKGYNADGTPQCATFALSCPVRSSANTANTTSVSITCNAGEQMTGGGCYSNNVNLSANYQADLCPPSVILGASDVPGAVSPAASLPPPGGGVISICIGGGARVRTQQCNSLTAGTLEAFATCCTVQ